MSTPDPLFLDPGHGDLERAARALIDALGVKRRSHDDVLTLYSEEITEEIGAVGGRFEINDWQDWKDLETDEVTAADIAVYDDAPLVWMLRPPTNDPGEQRRRSRGVFDLVVGRLGWSAILTRDFDTLVAAYDGQRGLREFPPDTWSNATARHIWG